MSTPTYWRKDPERFYLVEIIYIKESLSEERIAFFFNERGRGGGDCLLTTTNDFFSSLK